MKNNRFIAPAAKLTVWLLLVFVSHTIRAQNATVSTPMGIGKNCGAGSNTTDSFRVLNFNDVTNQSGTLFQCKPVLGGVYNPGAVTGPNFSSAAGSVAFNPKDQNVYYIATTTGNNSFVYNWSPDFCPFSTSPRLAPANYYANQFVVGLDFEPKTGDGYQLEFDGANNPYLRKVNFSTNTFGTSVPITLPPGKQITVQNGDVIFTPNGKLYIAFDNKMFLIDYSNYASGTVTSTFIDDLNFGPGTYLTGISYAQGKFLGSTQNGNSTVCSFKEIDISTGAAVISDVTLTNSNNFTATDMATLITGIGVAKTLAWAGRISGTLWGCQFDIRIKNFGNADLKSVQLTDSVAKAFGAYFDHATLQAVGTLPPGLTLNTAYNGSTNCTVFTGGAASTMNASPADSATVRVSVWLNNPNLTTTYYNTAVGTASSVLFSQNVSDSSNNDGVLRADLNGNSTPDDVNEDIPTPLNFSTWTSLPNRIVNFNAELINQTVAVHWAVENSTEGATVNIQRSPDSRTFSTIGTVPASVANHAAYTWEDAGAGYGNNFYRLQFVQQGGAVSYSGTVRVAREQSLMGFRVTPNPFTQSISFLFTTGKEEQVTYRLTDLNARLLRKGSKTVQQGENRVSMEDLSRVPPGTYLLQVTVGEETYRKTVVKAY